MKRLMANALVLTLVFGIARGYEKDKKDTFSLSKTTVGVSWAKHVKQGFSMQVWLSNQIAMGIEAWDPLPVPIEDCGVGIGLDYPAGTSSCIEHLFGAGPMIGGKINNVRRVSQSYDEGGGHEFVPERKDTLRDKIWYTSTANDQLTDFNFTPPRHLATPVNRRACDDDGDGLVDEDELDGFDNDGDWVLATDDVGSDGVPDALETGCKGSYDPLRNHDPAGDNYEPTRLDTCHPDPESGVLPLKRDKDRYTEKNGIPDHGEPHVDEDYGAVSDRDYYMYSTDTAKSAPGAVGSDHFPMGVKLFMKTYSWRGSFAQGIIPIDYYFINIGRYTIKDVYIGINSDMDVGPVNNPSYAVHNFACYLSDLRTAYIHNAQDRGSTPLGITVLGTPVPLDQLQYVFQWYDNGQLGTLDSIVYTWLDGSQFGGNLIKQCKPPETPADCRIFFSFGPFNGKDNVSGFKPGDTLKISMALVSGDGVTGTQNSMRANAEKAIRLFQNGYVKPAIPPSPAMKITEGFKKVSLQWFPHQSALGGAEGPYDVWDDSNKIADVSPDTGFRRINPPCGTGAGGCNGGHVCDANGRLPGGRIIEGFRLYRSEDPGNLTPAMSSFTLLKQFDLKDDPFEFNVGIESTFVDTNLTRGKRYWYAVTSFSIPNIAVIATPSDSTGTNYSYDTLYTAGAESDVSENAVRVDLSFSSTDNAGEVLVVPNPYRVDRDYTYESGGWEGRTSVWTENNRLVKFIHLPKRCTIRVFTLAGDHVTTIEHSDPVKGEEEWNLLSESNRALASGVYIFTVEAYDPNNSSDQAVIGKQVGKFVLIR